MTTRREFVSLLLGAPLAAALGCRSRPRGLPPGTLVDTGMQRAHAFVRDPVAPVVTAWRRHAVVVVGGGVAGLAAAWELRRRGVRDVVVLELEDVAGGTARGAASAVTPYPWGAHYVVAPAREHVELAALLAEMGGIEGHDPDGTPIVDEALRCREPEERVWYLGTWWDGLYLHAGSSDEDRAQLAAFNAEIDRWTTWRDARGRPAFAIPRSRCSDAPELVALDQITFADWLDARGLTSPRLRWLCDYACRDDYALTPAQTSAWAGLFYFAGRQRAPGADSQPVVTWPDGNGAIVRHLAHGVQLERGVAVLDIAGAADEARVIAVGPAGAFGIAATAVIVAAPTFVADRIVAARRDRAARAPVGDHGAWAVANVHLRGRPVERGGGASPAWDNVFRDSPSLGYVTATHQRGRDRGPTVWTWYYPFTDDDSAAVRRRLAGAGYAEWAEVVLADLARAHPDVRAHVDHIEVAFWGHGMIRPRVGAVWDPARLARAHPDGRIHYAHTDLSGFALFEEAFDHGLRAAREVAEAMRA
jgi:phytoene dehydrogenase-like protein